MKGTVGEIFTLSLLFCFFLFLSPSRSIAEEETRDCHIRELGKKILSMFLEGKYQELQLQFHPSIQEYVQGDILQQAWEEKTGALGKYKGIDSIHAETGAMKDVVSLVLGFEKDQLDFIITMDHQDKILSLQITQHAEYSPPAYADPSSFKEGEVTLGDGDWALPGLLTIPEGEGSFPCVILVHGSGPNDRDETIASNKPFKDLAWGLSSRGMAVLRYDKRTKVYAPRLAFLMKNFTVKEETIDDVVQAVSLLKKDRRIKKDGIFVLGHSLGGMLIPRIALADPTPAGYIIMAGATLKLEDISLYQYKYIFSLDGKTDANQQKKIDEIERDVQRIKALKPEDAESEERIMNAPVSYWLDLRDYYPGETVKKVQKPLLILQGERDYQVTMENFNIWKDALADGPHVVFKSYPTLNHLFMPGEGQSTPDEYTIPSHVDKEVIEDITTWIKNQQNPDGSATQSI